MLFLLCLVSVTSYSQGCREFTLWKGCLQKVKNYTVYQQPKTSEIGINDTLKYHVVFYGNMDYVISFCAIRYYYPIHVKLLKEDTNEQIYDNATDDYYESIGIGFYKTQNIILQITLLADKLGDKKIKSNDRACIGMATFCKKIILK